MFAYFDSNHDSQARSMGKRTQNPYWYIENKYEVTTLLAKPSSYPRIIHDTTVKKAQYSFASAQQREQLKSTMLCCLDVGTPCAVVVSSDAKNAFRESDPEVTSFVKFIGTMVHFDLASGRSPVAVPDPTVIFWVAEFGHLLAIQDFVYCWCG